VVLSFRKAKLFDKSDWFTWSCWLF